MLRIVEQIKQTFNQDDEETNPLCLSEFELAKNLSEPWYVVVHGCILLTLQGTSLTGQFTTDSNVFDFMMRLRIFGT